jgi:hypothetical protein
MNVHRTGLLAVCVSLGLLVPTPAAAGWLNGKWYSSVPITEQTVSYECHDDDRAWGCGTGNCAPPEMECCLGNSTYAKVCPGGTHCVESYCPRGQCCGVYDDIPESESGDDDDAGESWDGGSDTSARMYDESDGGFCGCAATDGARALASLMALLGLTLGRRGANREPTRRSDPLATPGIESPR